MKLAEDVEDSTLPLDSVGAKLLPVTDTERGAILKGLSTVQYNGQAGKILPQCAAATQDRIPVALNNGK